MNYFFFSLLPEKVVFFSVFVWVKEVYLRWMQLHQRTWYPGCIYLRYTLFLWVQLCQNYRNLRMLFSGAEEFKVSPCPSDCSRTNFVSVPEFWGIVLPWKSVSVSGSGSLFVVWKVKLFHLLGKHCSSDSGHIDVLYIWWD